MSENFRKTFYLKDITEKYFEKYDRNDQSEIEDGKIKSKFMKSYTDKVKCWVVISQQRLKNSEERIISPLTFDTKYTKFFID